MASEQAEQFSRNASEYRVQNNTVVNRIAREFEDAGGEMEDLDDLVIDVAGIYGADDANETTDEDEQEAAISAGERVASIVNNCDVDEQVAAILMGHGEEEGERLIMEAIDNSPKP